MVTEAEVQARINKLKSLNPVVINKRMLRGGMDYRNKRRMVDNYNKKLEKETNKQECLLSKLKLAPKKENNILKFGAFSEPVVNEPEDSFLLPKLNKTRIGGRGWF